MTEKPEKILSQDEVKALLKTTPDAVGGPGEGTGAAPAGLTVYDFRRPDKVPKSVLQSIQIVYDRFATNASASLAAYLRTLTKITIHSVEQTALSEFLHSMPDPTCVSVVSVKPLSGVGVLEVGLDLAFPLINRLLGGPGRVDDSNRKMTEIEKNVIQEILQLITGDLDEAWRPVTEVTFKTESTETRADLLQIGTADEIVVVATFDVRVGETMGSIRLSLADSMLKPIAGGLQRQISEEKKIDHSSDLAKVVRCLLRVPLEVSSELPPTMVTVRDLLSIGKGDVIRLDTKIDERIQLQVGGKPAFHAEALDVNGRKGAGVIASIAE